MKYRSEIDGLRAVAVLPVILFHTGISAFSGGFVGVDIFFVISGYLITSIILAEMEAGTFSLVNFYERRARRILPALFLVMLISLPFSWFFLLPSDMKDFSQSLVAVSFFSSNILFWYESGYWDAASELKPLLHTWSLAVEEQYYVLFPLFLMLMWRYRKRWILSSFMLLAGVSLAIAQWGAYNMPTAAFYLLPARGWELAVGACIAFYFMYRKQTIRKLLSHKLIDEVLGLLGLLMIFYAVFTFDSKTPFPGFYALVPTVGTGLIILFSSNETVSGRILGSRPLVAIGLISYSIYLWHQPLLAFARHGVISISSEIAYVILVFSSLPIAYLSWRYIEKPFRTKGVFSRQTIFLYSLVGTVFFIGVGVIGHFTNGFESFWVSRQSENVQLTYSVISHASKNSNFMAGKGEQQSKTSCRFRVKKIDNQTKKRIIDCYKKYNKGYVVLGDSHAIDLFGVVISSSSYPFIISFTRSGCRPHTPKSGCYYNDFLNFAKENKNIFNGVIYEQAGFYLLRNKEKKGNRAMIANIPYNMELKGIYPDKEHIQKVYKYLKRLSKHVNVVWFGPRVEPHISNKMILKRSCDFEFVLRPNQRDFFNELDSYINSLVETSDNFRFVSQNKSFKYHFPDDFMDCKGLYWSDGDHLSTLGEVRFGKRFDLLELLTPKEK